MKLVVGQTVQIQSNNSNKKGIVREIGDNFVRIGVKTNRGIKGVVRFNLVNGVYESSIGSIIVTN